MHVHVQFALTTVILFLHWKWISMGYKTRVHGYCFAITDIRHKKIKLKHCVQCICDFGCALVLLSCKICKFHIKSRIAELETFTQNPNANIDYFNNNCRIEAGELVWPIECRCPTTRNIIECIASITLTHFGPQWMCVHCPILNPKK